MILNQRERFVFNETFPIFDYPVESSSALPGLGKTDDVHVGFRRLNTTD